METSQSGMKLIGSRLKQIEVADGVYGFSNKSKEYMGEKVTFPKLSKKNEDIIFI